jgi:hypothetical protein
MSGCQSAVLSSILKYLVEIDSAAYNSIFNAHDNLAIDGTPIYFCD